MTILPTQWPSAADYVAAVQDSERCLLDERLRSAQFNLNGMGIPVVRSGQTAAVFPVQIQGEQAAVRLFTVPTDQAERYRLISAHFNATPSELFVPAEWVPRAVAFGTGVYPAVLMPWVAGVSLSSFIDDAIEEDRASQLKTLAEVWLRAALELPRSSVVHGDLQHGNVLVDPSLRVRLIDYDGSWVPGVSLRTTEIGHPNYQHPQRVELQEVTETTDVFSSFVIYVSLRAVASDPSLWDRFHNGENLIFTQTDYAEAGRRGAPIWEELASSTDAEIVALGQTLNWLSRARLAAMPTLARLIEAGEAAVDKNDLYVLDRAGRETGRNWYEDEHIAEVSEPEAWGGRTPWRESGEPLSRRATAPTDPAAQQSPAASYSTAPASEDDGVDRTLRRVAIGAIALSVLIVVMALAILATR